VVCEERESVSSISTRGTWPNSLYTLGKSMELEEKEQSLSELAAGPMADEL